MSARFLVTVSQYQGVFASAIAHLPGPNLKSGSQTSASSLSRLSPKNSAGAMPTTVTNTPFMFRDCPITEGERWNRRFQ